VLGFYQAAVPDGWQILGVRLKPLSLGHLILLHRYESAFVVGGLPTPADLVMSVLICSRTFGAPPEQTVKVGLMSQLGLSEAEVLNRPFSLCLWDLATLAEMNGSLKIYSQRDAELKEQAEELEESIERGDFNPDNVRNN
jgi:hypothetical protein